MNMNSRYSVLAGVATLGCIQESHLKVKSISVLLANKGSIESEYTPSE